MNELHPCAFHDVIKYCMQLRWVKGLANSLSTCGTSTFTGHLDIGLY